MSGAITGVAQLLRVAVLQATLGPGDDYALVRFPPGQRSVVGAYSFALGCLLPAIFVTEALRMRIPIVLMAVEGRGFDARGLRDAVARLDARLGADALAQLQQHAGRHGAKPARQGLTAPHRSILIDDDASAVDS